MEAWSQYLPKYGDPPFKLAHDGSNGPSGGHAGPTGQPNGGSAAGSNGGGGGGAGSEESTAPSEDEDADEEDDEDDANSSAVQAKRNQVVHTTWNSNSGIPVKLSLLSSTTIAHPTIPP